MNDTTLNQDQNQTGIEAQIQVLEKLEATEQDVNLVVESKQEQPIKIENTKSVIESMLFASERPLLIEQIKKVLESFDSQQISQIVDELKKEYEMTNRGFRIYEVAGGYQMIAAPDFSGFLKKLFRGGKGTDKLSKSALETLAIVSYRQPITRGEIEELRKVNIDGVLKTLIDKNVIRVVGRKKVPGRPKVYGTTRFFLEYFGLKSLYDLPKIENFPLPEELREQMIEKIDENSPEAQDISTENNVVNPQEENKNESGEVA